MSIGYRHVMINSSFLFTYDKMLDAPIFQLSEIVEISDTYAKINMRTNINSSIKIAALTTENASISDIDNALLLHNDTLVGNTPKEIILTGLSSNTIYYIHFYASDGEHVGNTQKPVFLRTLTSGIIRGSLIVDMTDNPIIEVDGSNRIKRISSIVNNYKLQQFTDAYKPIYENNSIKSNETTQNLRIQPAPIISQIFTIAIVGNNKLNPIWFYSLPKYFSSVGNYFFINNPISIRDNLNANNNNISFNSTRDSILGEHTFIITSNGTTTYCFVDGMLIGSIATSSWLLREVNYICADAIRLYTPYVRFIKLAHEYTSDIVSLHAELSTKLTGDLAPGLTGVTYNQTLVTTGTVVAINGYTYLDSEGAPQGTPRYKWETSINGGGTWVDALITTSSITIPGGWNGRLLRGGVMVTATTGNFASGSFTFGSSLTII